MKSPKAIISFYNHLLLDEVRSIIEKLSDTKIIKEYHIKDKYQLLDQNVKRESHVIEINFSDNVNIINFNRPINISKTINNYYNTNLGYHRHLSDNQSSNNNISLGKIRFLAKDVEPLIRDTEYVFFNLDAVRKADIPGNDSSSVVGFTAEEACQLMRYIGEANQLKLVFISFETDVENDFSTLSELIGLMIWYLLEGFSMPKVHPKDQNGFITKLVELNELDKTLEFYYNEETDKWWVKSGDMDFKPCTYKDYEETINGEIPDVLISTL